MSQRFTGKLRDAEATLSRAMTLADAALPADDQLRGETRQYLAVVLIESGREKEGVTLTEEALEVFQRDPSKHANVIGTLKNNLAVSAYNQGRLDDARVLYEQAIGFNRAGGRQAELAPVLINLGVVYRLQGRYDDAERVLREGIALRVATLGPEHPFVAIGQAHLGDTLVHVGRLTEARTELERALAIQRKQLPAGHLDLARSTSVLGLLECRDGHTAEGETLLREALGIRQRHLPAGHWLTASVQSALGECLAGASRMGEATVLLRESAADIERALGGSHPMTIEAKDRIARWVERQSPALVLQQPR